MRRIVFLISTIGCIAVGFHQLDRVSGESAGRGLNYSHSSCFSADLLVKLSKLSRIESRSNPLVGDRETRGLFDVCYKQNSTTFKLYGHERSEDVRFSNFTSVEEMQKSKFNPKKPTILIIHGFMSCPDNSNTRNVFVSPNYPNAIKRLIHAREEANVFYVDWNHMAMNFNYPEVVENMPYVARDAYDILSNLQKAFPTFDKHNILIMGHSLGSHIAGLIGQNMGGKLDQIIALDPAGQIRMQDVENDKKLTKNDAKYVIAVHTEWRFFGTYYKVADVDVYFNEGKQPGCSRGLATCDHTIVADYHQHYLANCVQTAYVCGSFGDFMAGKCGWCAEDSTDCVGLGILWQYKERLNLRPNGFDKVKSGTDENWIENTNLAYHINSGHEKPYCVFNYQVIVVPKNGEEISLNSSLTFHAKERTAQVSEFRRLASGEVRVFDEAGKEKSIKTSGILTALLSIDVIQNIYYDLPLKFTKVTSSQDLPQIDVYLNFMSHPNYKKRMEFSGPVELSEARSHLEGKPKKAIHRSMIKKDFHNPCSDDAFKKFVKSVDDKYESIMKLEKQEA